MSAFHDIILAGAAGQQGYKISRSVRLRSSASAYFSRTPAGAGNRQTWTLSCWMKRGALSAAMVPFSAGSTGNEFVIDWRGFDALDFYDQTASVSSAGMTTNAVYRDPSAWYHIVFAWDTTQATSTNRWKLYINGVQITSFSATQYPSQNYQGYVNSTVAHYIGIRGGSTTPFDGYLTEINFIDGQALTPSSFGEYNAITGVWQPKKYGGTYGTNGFYLNFSDNSAATAAAIGKDYSGNGNNWTPNNISVTAGVTYDSMLDVPTPYADGGNGRGNYCVYNPLTFRNSRPPTTYSSISNANLTATFPSGVASGYVFGSMYVSSGKWYWEYSPTTISGATFCGIDTGAASNDVYTNAYCYVSNGNKWANGSSTAYGATYTTTNVIGVALDLDAGTLTFYKDGVSQGTAFTGITGSFSAFVFSDSGSVVNVNFGQRPFTYTPPTGFKALNTQNLPDSTINNGAKYMAATTYTGTGASLPVSNAVNGVGFQPDLVWMKSRSNATFNDLTDSVRGVTKVLYSNDPRAEDTISDNLTSFDANGFTIAANSTFNTINVSPRTYVAWQWKKGATQGFDVVAFTSTGTTMTVNHSLGVTPDFVILKRRDSADNWYVNHSSFATRINNWLALNSTAAISTVSTTFTGFSSTTVSFGGGLMVNGATYVMYAFANVAGFSKFGSYTGNGSTDGVFVYTGFRPRYVLVKASSAVEGWVVWDSARDTYNAMPDVLYPNGSNAEVGGTQIDFLSNGFKLRNSATNGNISGVTYIYAAFAENPAKYALAR